MFWYAIGIVIIFVIIMLRKKSESMKCTRELYNLPSTYAMDVFDKHETNSANNMDYTYSYWDGVNTLSCDECPNVYSCPSCPVASMPRSSLWSNEDEKFMQSREGKGAAMVFAPKCKSQSNESFVDEKLDCVDGRSVKAMQLLYAGVLGLENPPPDNSGCEYTRANGYIDKEPCTDEYY
jgi:hypothetical protein